ncbi:hypothetical protein RJD24_10310 [Bacillaceae bacterium IKA-2]|nr:hypothetical protein RJD24_10310 [Bacillaceae bacterium IKA-2]
MHPTEVLQLMVVGVIIVVIIAISFFLKGKWRYFGWSLALIVLVVFYIFYFARPYWIDAQIDKKVGLLEPYLEQHYPNEVWTITTVPHREDGYKHLNPYYIGVIFVNETDVIYHYWVEDENDIYQISHQTKH